MALEGIGSKFAIHKVTDFTKDASAMQKRAQLVNSDAQKQLKAQVEQEAVQVTQAFHADEAIIQRERGKNKRNRHGGDEASGEKTEGKDTKADGQKTPPGYKKIDIHI